MGEEAVTAVSECSFTILDAAVRAGGEVVAFSCPLCLYNLDVAQDRIEQVHFGFKKIPIVYFSQLLAIALGLDPANYALDSEHHFVDPSDLVQSLAKE